MRWPTQYGSDIGITWDLKHLTQQIEFSPPTVVHGKPNVGSVKKVTGNRMVRRSTQRLPPENEIHEATAGDFLNTVSARAINENMSYLAKAAHKPDQLKPVNCCAPDHDCTM
jgi:hypothetical protein